VAAALISVVAWRSLVYAQSAAPIITALSSLIGTGQAVTLKGSGFLSRNIVWIYPPASSGSGEGYSVGSADGITLTTPSLPASVFPPGVYLVSVTNANGYSNVLSITVVSAGSSPTITTTSTVTPVITAVPSFVTVGEVATIKGNGFLSQNVVWLTGPSGITQGSLAQSTDGVTLYVNLNSNFSSGGYIVEVYNANGTSNKVTLTVSPAGSLPPPVITSFSANPTSIPSGQSAALSWVVSGATSLSINSGVGTVSGSSVAIYPAQTTTYTLTAKGSGGSVTQTVTVTVTAAITKGLSACQDISTAGNYMLTANLTAPPSTSCFNLHDAANITLDCAGHSITSESAYPYAAGVVVNNAPGFTLKNCRLNNGALGTATPFANVTGSNGGTLTNNTFGSLNAEHYTSGTYVEVSNSNYITFSNNILYGGYYQAFSSYAMIQGNTIQSTLLAPDGLFALIGSQSGGNNTFTSNVLNGNSPNPGSEAGSDGGVIISDESGDTISNNQISNTWDCGVESVGNLNNASIVGNTISNTYNGICGYHWTSILNSTISGNTVSTTRTLFEFYRIEGLRPANAIYPGSPADTGVYFENNTVAHNTYSNPYIAPGSPNAYDGSARVNLILEPAELLYPLDYNSLNNGPGETTPSNSQFYMTGNTFTDNNFGASNFPPVFGTYYSTTVGGPTTYPSGLVIDGGGNICNVSANGPSFPLTCLGQ
jgi:hypothetical protein